MCSHHYPTVSFCAACLQTKCERLHTVNYELMFELGVLNFHGKRRASTIKFLQTQFNPSQIVLQTIESMSARHGLCLLSNTSVLSLFCHHLQISSIRHLLLFITGAHYTIVSTRIVLIFVIGMLQVHSPGLVFGVPRSVRQFPARELGATEHYG